MHRMWRLGSTKAQEGFPFVNKIKYLGVKLSYGSFEQATLQYRLQEGNVKLQKVRKYVHNRRTSRPKARLHIWNATVWAAVASGLVTSGSHIQMTSALLPQRWNRRAKNSSSTGTS